LPFQSPLFLERRTLRGFSCYESFSFSVFLFYHFSEKKESVCPFPEKERFVRRFRRPDEPFFFI